MCKIVHFYPELIDWKVIAQKKKKKPNLKCQALYNALN